MAVALHVPQAKYAHLELVNLAVQQVKPYATVNAWIYRRMIVIAECAILHVVLMNAVKQENV